MDLNEYQQRAGLTAIYPNKGEIGGFTYVALKLNGEAGEVAEKLGKIMRDDNSVISSEKRELLAKEVGDVLWYIAMAARELGYDLSEIAAMNLAKLADRKNRNMLSGSGDTR